MQEGYASIVAVYRDLAGTPPAVLVKEVRAVEGDLHVNSEDRLTAETLFPYLGLLVRMKNTDSVIAKRDLYRQVVTFIEDPQQEYTVNKEDAEQLLDFLLVNPPFPSLLNPAVGVLAVGAVAVITTVWGSVFQRKTYGGGVSTLGRRAAMGRCWSWHVCAGLGVDQQGQCAPGYRFCARGCARLPRIAGERILTCCALVVPPSCVSPRHFSVQVTCVQQRQRWGSAPHQQWFTEWAAVLAYDQQ